jgi:hypothetical protein
VLSVINRGRAVRGSVMPGRTRWIIARRQTASITSSLQFFISTSLSVRPPCLARQSFAESAVEACALFGRLGLSRSPLTQRKA